MKRIFILFLFAFVACACQKSPADSLCGSYSFKTGGYLEILASGITPAGDTVVNSSVVPESGQMRILPKNRDEVVVTMNVTGGSPVVFNAAVSDGKIVLEPTSRKITLFNELSFFDFPTDAVVGAEGIGSLYGNTLVFDMEYHGKFETAVRQYTILFSKVNCIATRNE